MSQDSTASLKALTIDRRCGPVLISADLHGHWEDFARLRQIFLDSSARGEAPLWVSVGDWVHGPDDTTLAPILDSEGAPLYDYPDRSPQILRALFALMDSYPGQVLSLCGNHEYAHIGGPRTRKFHDDEAAHLEGALSAAEVNEVRRRFASWPLLVLLPSCGVAITHGAMAGPLRSAKDLEQVRYGQPNDGVAAVLLETAMTHYGYTDGGDIRLLSALQEPGGPPYGLLVHGHDREETGYASTGERALLLCSSFGARRQRKAYLWLDLSRRYDGPGALREGHEIRFLWT